jgi:hypothetical protein
MPTQHTPGPWRTKRKNNPYNIRVGVDGLAVAYVPRPKWGYDAPDTDEVSQANARLIAAAPELLECLQDLIEHIQKHDHTGFYKKHVQKALPVLSKACGKV